MNENIEDLGTKDCLTDEDMAAIEKNHQEILNELHERVYESDNAREWLNSKLGKRFVKFLAADKLRAMRTSSTTDDKAERKKAKLDYAVAAKIEVIFGQILVDGNEALQQLEQQHQQDIQGDSHED